MIRKLVNSLLPLLTASIALAASGAAQSATKSNGSPTFPRRDVLAQEIHSEEFGAIVGKICDPETEVIADARLQRTWKQHGKYFFRVSPRSYYVDSDGNFARDQAMLGGKPYVFSTIPEGVFGRSLYGIYSDLGYDAESLIRQRGVEMIGIVYRYEDVELSETVNGKIPETDFDSFVYRPTWANAFRLFELLAGAPAPDGSAQPWKYFQMNERQRDLARFLPRERLRRIRLLPYEILRSAGGPDWEYRTLLEQYMSMNAHFRGVGVTENTLSPGDRRKGLPEYVGPNKRIADLPEFAIIELGKMEFVETHRPRKTEAGAGQSDR